MNKRIVFIVGILISSTAFGQVRDLMLKKAGGMINGKKETTTSTTDTTQKATTNDSQKQSTPMFGGLGSKADAQAEYVFNANTYVEIQNYKKDGTKDGDTTNVRYHFGKEDYYGTQMIMTDKKGKTTESFGIAEFPKNQMVSFITDENGEKTGTVMKVNLDKQIEKSSDSSNVTITKTGNVKTILNYKCEEYKILDKEGNTTLAWMTTELPYNINKMFAGQRGNNEQYQGISDGFMMEMTYTEKDEKKTTWIVKEVNLNTEKKVVTADYSFPY